MITQKMKYALKALLVLADDSAEVLAHALLLQSKLISAGDQVRLERRPKKLNLLLENLASQGYSRFAVVDTNTDAASLELRPIA